MWGVVYHCLRDSFYTDHCLCDSFYTDHCLRDSFYTDHGDWVNWFFRYPTPKGSSCYNRQSPPYCLERDFAIKLEWYPAILPFCSSMLKSTFFAQPPVLFLPAPSLFIALFEQHRSINTHHPDFCQLPPFQSQYSRTRQHQWCTCVRVCACACVCACVCVCVLAYLALHLYSWTFPHTRWGLLFLPGVRYQQKRRF